MPWPEPDPHDVKVTRWEFVSALAYRVVLIAFAIILLGVLAYGLSLPD